MIAVTGGSGFLGRHLLRALKEKHTPFLTLSRSALSLEEVSREKQHIINFASVPEIAKALRGATQILHLAGQINGPIQSLVEANPGLMGRVTEAAKQTGIRRIIYLSSVAALPRNGPYGQTKWEAEEILRSSNIPYIIFRPTMIYGAGDTKNVAWIEKMLKLFPVLPLLGGGKFMIQPVYVADVVCVVIRALEGDFVHRTYNLAGPSQISLKEMIEVISESLGRKPHFLPVPLKPVQTMVRLWSLLFPGTRLPVKQILELDRHLAFDIEPAREDLGFTPRTFHEGIRAMTTSEFLCAG